MKTLTILTLAICIGLCSCSKNSNTPQPVKADPHLVGDWKLVSDSTSAASPALGTHGDKYIGTSADRVVFSQDGKLSINEGSSVATGTFAFHDDGSLQFQYTSRQQGNISVMGSSDYFQTVSIDEHDATLSNAGWAPAGIYLVRIVRLSR